MRTLLCMIFLLPSLAFAMEHDPWFSFTRIELAADDRGGKQFAEGGWIGGDINRLWWDVAVSGQQGAAADEATVSAWFGHYIAPFWDAQIGVRSDIKPAHEDFLSVGVRGLAPYQFDTDIKLEVRSDGKWFVHGRFEQDVLMTNQFILLPWLDASVSATDIDATVRAGLYRTDIGLQARYEFTRKLAPFLEVSRTLYFHTMPSGEAQSTRYLAGLRLIF